MAFYLTNKRYYVEIATEEHVDSFLDPEYIISPILALRQHFLRRLQLRFDLTFPSLKNVIRGMHVACESALAWLWNLVSSERMLLMQHLASN
ncbi:hypothetical protein MUP01_09255 [Candidatus Bathyarchaeota archaeon]|nr:hypothetical protein [Candidatus Bathyarchaeota archaeon]